MRSISNNINHIETECWLRVNISSTRFNIVEHWMHNHIKSKILKYIKTSNISLEWSNFKSQL